jgi:hypothetical protein
MSSEGKVAIPPNRGLVGTTDVVTDKKCSLRLSTARYATPAPGDKLREASGIRPSLHPITINAISEILKRKAFETVKPETSSSSSKLQISDSVRPIDVAIETSTIVMEILQKRRDTSKQDGMVLQPKEEQTVAGRVLGVIMRLDELGSLLYNQVSSVDWIRKYQEWTSFGILEDPDLIEGQIAKDPLFCLTRAECLLALFLHTVESPKLRDIGETVPDGGRIDFIDTDRLEVLLCNLE